MGYTISARAIQVKVESLGEDLNGLWILTVTLAGFGCAFTASIRERRRTERSEGASLYPMSRVLRSDCFEAREELVVIKKYIKRINGVCYRVLPKDPMELPVSFREVYWRYQQRKKRLKIRAWRRMEHEGRWRPRHNPAGAAVADLQSERAW